jgi:hypothetical protein
MAAPVNFCMLRARVFARAQQREGKMKSLSMTLMVSAVGLAFVLASPAQASNAGKQKKSAATAHVVKHRQTAEAVPAAEIAYQGGVRRGPLYNGQDYLGDDPDPSVRAFLIKNLSGRYGGSF